MQLTDLELTSTAPGQAPTLDAVWIPAVVPGGVHESLLAAGQIEHPYFGMNEEAIGWIEERSWWYRCQFDAGAQDGEPVELVLDGLDTVAEIWLNDVHVGSHRNQHRPFVADVTSLLSSRSELLIRIDPPLEGLMTAEEKEVALVKVRARQAAVRPNAIEPPADELLLAVIRNKLRKATFSWGWDFALRAPSVGLLSPISLRRKRSALDDVQVRTLQLDVAQRTATLLVVSSAPARVTITAPDGSTVEGSTGSEISLTDVQLWWTHDLGGQPLYEVRVELGDETWERRIGLRTLALDRSTTTDEPGRLFRFVLNGVPLFARGANWVPASNLVGSVTAATYRGLVELARDAEMTMLRVWGGGIYEPDVFYDTCDALGLLVWQDFMFACFDYPDDAELWREIELEAIHQVKRLRHHASLALWCGENEVQAIHEMVTGTASKGEWGWSIFNELLPRVVAEHHPDGRYWPGSPWGEATTEIVNGVTDGDRHAWEVWHGIAIGAGGPTEFETRGEAVHFHRYAHDNGRFISEFGIHASPELATLQRWSPPGSLALDSPMFLHRNKDTPKDKGSALMERETGLPATLADYVDFSMACQAEGLKFGIEHYRRRQALCSGTLVWQLNDSWPGLSWSVIDHDLVPKAGYYFLQRVYRPVIASFRTTPDGVELWVTNATTQEQDLELIVDVAGFHDGLTTGEVSARVPSSTSIPVWHGSLPTPDQFAWVSSTDRVLEPNRAFFAPLKDLPLKAEVEADVERTGPHTAIVRVKSGSYSYFTRLASSELGVRFSRNYLDLRPHEARTIEVSGLTPTTQLSVASYGQPEQRIL